jgi:hypothetical protein
VTTAGDPKRTFDDHPSPPTGGLSHFWRLNTAFQPDPAKPHGEPIMGWTFMPSHGRDRAEIIRGKLDWDNDTFTDKVADHAVIGTTVYLVVCRTPKATWEPSTIYVNDADGSFRWIAVFLTRKARDAYDFGYKPLEESMGPVEASCPRRLIAAASPLRNPDPAVEGNYAARWRQKCLDGAKTKARRKAELVPGATIHLSRALDFTDGYSGDRFVVEIVRRRGRNHTYFRAPNGGLYRISNLDGIGYRVEAAAV